MVKSRGYILKINLKAGKSKFWKRMISDNRGSAMITALVVGIVIFAFCLSMLLVAYTLFAQTSRTEVALGCKNLAQSTAEEIGKELGDTATYSNVDSLSYYLVQKGQEFKAAEDEANAGNAGERIEIEKKLRLELNSSNSSIDNYSIFVTFDFESAKKVNADIECYRDYGNLNDVQSYTVHTEYTLK